METPKAPDTARGEMTLIGKSVVVMGDIATQRISIDEGAYFKGSVNIQQETPKEGSTG